MNRGRAMRAMLAITTISLTISANAYGQRQPATIPTAVAQSITLDGSMLGRPRYFNGQPPTDWPTTLIPSGAALLGGAVVGNPLQFRMRTAVFSFGRATAPSEVISTLLASAGYAKQGPPTAWRGGGFASTESPTPASPFCKDGMVASFGVVDSTENPYVVAITLIDGDVGRQYCGAIPSTRESGRFPVTVPTLTPPRGTVGGGGASSSWGSDGGTVQSSLLTTLGADSILMHYTTQLVAGGWAAEGRSAVADNVAVQRFLFSEGQERWTAALVVTAIGERKDVLLRLMKRD